MDVSVWQKRLEENFSHRGIVGGHLLEIIEMEKAYGEFFVKKYHGQSVLIDSFQSFFIETLQVAQDWIQSKGWPTKAPNYVPMYLYFLTLFKSFRACENLLISGYPYDGYALLRDIKDRIMFLGAIAKNITTLPKIMGYGLLGVSSSPGEYKRIKPIIMKEEKKAHNKMLRKESDLPKDIKEELTRWEQLFHEEVHGSRFTYFMEGPEWLKGGKPPSLGPKPKDLPMLMYMNRASEIGWLLVRLLPFLQPIEKAFGDSWFKRHEILDDSFREMIKSLSELGKKIADAFIYFADDKFKFPDTFHYFEADE